MATWRLEPAPHGLDQAAEHALGRSRTDRRSGDVADVAAAAGGEQGEADQRREGGATMRVRETGDLPWPSNPDRAAEHALHVIGNVLELCAAAGQHHLAADGAGK